MTIDSNIDLFFEDPESKPVIPGQFSILYLLRRDIRNCIINRQALWPGAMAVLAGIDLLGKFYAGDDSNGQVGKRFKDFIKKYFQPIAQDDATTMYQLRNALLHSFGLYSEVKRKGKVYHFSLVAENETGPLVRVYPQNANYYLVDLLVLYAKFEDAVAYYLGDLRIDKDLQAHFNDMFPKYGAISIYAVQPG
jgi:hypothetical protein